MSRMIGLVCVALAASWAVAQEETGPKTIPGVLDLDTALRIALEDSPSLQAAGDRVEQARMRVRQARSAYFPQITAGAMGVNKWLSENDYSRAREQVLNSYITPVETQLKQAIKGAILGGPPVDLPLFGQSFIEANAMGALARGKVDDSFESYSADLTATWVLFDGFRREFSNAAAKWGLKQSKASRDEARRLLMSAVAAAYYNAQLARENTAIATANKEFNERLLKEAEARERVGTGSVSDVLNFEVRANSALTALYQSERQYAVALIGLAELMGMPDASLPAGQELAPLDAETSQDLDRPEVEPLIGVAMSSRPDLRANEHVVGIAKANVGVARSAFFPTVAVSAAKDGLRTDNAKFGEDDFGTTVGLSMSYTVFSGGRIKAAHSEAKAAHSEARRNLQSAEISIASDVRTAIENLDNAQKEIRLQRDNARLVQKNRDLVEKEYNAGVGSLVRLNEAQRDLVEAQARLALALVSLRNLWFQLRTATGESLADYPD